MRFTNLKNVQIQNLDSSLRYNCHIFIFTPVLIFGRRVKPPSPPEYPPMRTMHKYTSTAKSEVILFWSTTCQPLRDTVFMY